MSITTQQIAEGRALVAAATPGPWELDCAYGDIVATIPSGERYAIARALDETDGEAIVYLLNNAPALLDAAAELAKYKAAVGGLLAAPRRGGKATLAADLEAAQARIAELAQEVRQLVNERDGLLLRDLRAKVRIAELEAENAKLQAVADAARELLEVADLRGDSSLSHPPDDPLPWSARMQTAWDESRAALAALDTPEVPNAE